ncbi:Dam family site-specific DNA-(adenine-N6)-methyltransferase [Methylosinus sporium]|nr:DNA adenine methylase [Methylosinus sporium]
MTFHSIRIDDKGTVMTPLSLQPIPYQGSKRALAPRICQVFPKQVDTLYEPFAGSAAVTLYAAHHRLAKQFVIGDVFGEIIDLWDLIINRPSFVAERYSAIWTEQFGKNDSHFNEVRARFNQDRDPIRLLYLIARCVKNAVRFNKQGDFSQSVDKRRTGMHPDKMGRTVCSVSKLLRGRTRLFKGDFQACLAAATASDLVYMDPPYQGTTYGADKRYAAQLSREILVEALHVLNRRGVSYILSYDGKSGERSYGDPLPPSINAAHLSLHAGRSSQATLSGRDDETIESLYVSKALDVPHVDIFKPLPLQASLFS